MHLVVGMDEVGRGCWAGPVVAGAVILKRNIPGLKDSKLLSRARRNELDAIIRKSALAVGIGWADVIEINEHGLTGALRLAFARAIAEVQSDIGEIIIDGNYNYLGADARVRTLVDADALVPVVSAASIVAKVARDNFMISISQKYPGYGFDQHVGYGTELHRTALASQGICDLHRTTWKPVQALMGL
jgi:ribonuclease HII